MYYRGSNRDLEIRGQAHLQVPVTPKARTVSTGPGRTGRSSNTRAPRRTTSCGTAPTPAALPPFKDTNPNCQPEARYKALAQLHRTGTSSDFLNWTSWPDPELLEFDDDIGPQQLYTNAVMSYPRAPQILIGFPTRLFPEQGNRVEPILMSSRDGRTFRRWAEPVIPEDAPEDRAGNRSNYLAWGLLPTPGNEREYSVYASENYLSSTPSRLRRFTYRVDGLVALRGGEQGGS